MGFFSKILTSKICKIVPLFHNCYQQIDTDGNPNLGFYCTEFVYTGKERWQAR